jgi:hypothetical protein
LGRFKAVDDSLTSFGDYLIRTNEAGKLDSEFLLTDDEFKIECFKLAGAVVGAVSGALGATGDTAKVMQQVLEKVAVVFKAGEIGARLGEISQILMDDSLDPRTQRAAVGKLVMELVSDAFSIAGDRAAAADKAKAMAAAAGGGGAGGGHDGGGGRGDGASGGGGGGGSTGDGGGGSGGSEQIDPNNLGGDLVLEPHPGGHQNEPAFIPADSDLPGAGSGDPDSLFDRSGGPIGEHADIISRLEQQVPHGQPRQRTAAAELHLAGTTPPVPFLEQSGAQVGDPAPTEGLTAPERHVLRPDEQPLHDQALGEVVPVPDPRRGQTRRGDDPRREAYLQANQVPGERPEHYGPRSHDAEAKVLERASAALAGNPDAAGELHLRPSHPPCPACTAAIFAFTGRHRNVRVILH